MPTFSGITSHRRPQASTAWDHQRKDHVAVDEQGVAADGTRYLTDQQRYDLKDKGELHEEKYGRIKMHQGENSAEAYTHDRNAHRERAMRDGNMSTPEMLRDMALSGDIKAAEARKEWGAVEVNMGSSLQRFASDGKITPLEQSQLDRFSKRMDWQQRKMNSHEKLAEGLRQNADAIERESRPWWQKLIDGARSMFD